MAPDKDKPAARDAFAPGRIGSYRRVKGRGSFEPRMVDHLQSLVDVLENMPAAKPSVAAIRVQLCAPLLLGGKSLYDTLASICGLVDDGASPAPKHLVALFFGIAFMAVSAWAWGWLSNAHNDALTKTDPHHKRCLQRAKRQLAEEKQLAGEPLDEDERRLLPSPVASLQPEPDNARSEDTSPPEGKSR
jgi:hypothetical protein